MSAGYIRGGVWGGCALLPIVILPERGTWIPCLHVAGDVTCGELLCKCTCLWYYSYPQFNCAVEAPIYYWYDPISEGLNTPFFELDTRLTQSIEGAPTVLFSVIVFFFLADSPGTAKFLTESEQTQAVERLQTVDQTAKNKMEWKQVLQGLSDYKNYIHMTIHFCCNYSFAGLSNFLPTIIQEMGYTSVNAQGLSAPPYFASFLLCIVAALISDRWGHRGLVITVSAVVGMVGYLILAAVEDEHKTGVRYFGVWLATCGVFPALSINITWLLNNQGGDSKKGAGMAILAVFGQCSSFVSSSAFPDSEG